MKTVLDQKLQQQLRAEGVIEENEIAYKEGDIFVAENVLSGARKIISPPVLTENKKQILFG